MRVDGAVENVRRGGNLVERRVQTLQRVRYRSIGWITVSLVPGPTISHLVQLGEIAEDGHALHGRSVRKLDGEAEISSRRL